MSYRLVVVESPNKVAKVSKCLGPGFKVVATIGHFRDLPDDELGVDLATFTPTYRTMSSKSAVVPRLKQAAADASEVLLATDADREGEAIAWHVSQVLGAKGLRRMRFTELTPAALRKALAAAGPLDGHLVDAQQARRIVDRLVGYQVSPLLSGFGPNHSAGRVQTATLHLVVARELVREAFRPLPFWSLTALYVEGFSAWCAVRDANGQWARRRFSSQAEALEAQAVSESSPHHLAELTAELVERKPKPPFTTSTLTQAASAALSLTPKKTMTLAQSLFEKGAITYHRTDSPSLSDEAIAMARAFLAADYPQCLPDVAPSYGAKAGAQEAHEAIRPTAVLLPADVTLSADEATLFTLITNRFLASQCKPAVLKRTTVQTEAGGVCFVVRGDVVVSPSFLVFTDTDEESVSGKEDGPQVEASAPLPALEQGQPLQLKRLERRAEETKPPPRFTAATLVREMERTGIGRPSTYAATIETLFTRKYLDEEKKAVFPTARGRVIDGALCAAFPSLVEASYTAAMEAQLDDVAEGRRGWKDALRQWNGPFSAALQRGAASLAAFYNANHAWVDEVAGAPRATDKACPRCGHKLLLKEGSKGPFLACPSRPTCDYTSDPSARPSTLACPTCSGAMEELDGKFGAYARCVVKGCKGRRDVASPTGLKCPSCGEGELRDKGQFIGCSNYPSCRFTVERKALETAVRRAQTCPKCGKLLIQRKGERGVFHGCAGYPVCRYVVDATPARPKKGNAEGKRSA